MNNSKIHIVFLFITILFSSLFSSCSKDDPVSPPPLPLPPSASGAWTGTLTYAGTPGSFSLNLTQDVILFTGNGNYNGLSVSISGDNHYPDIKFAFGATNYQQATFAGKFTSPTTLSGLVNGSGFTNATAEFTKN